MNMGEDLVKSILAAAALRAEEENGRTEDDRERDEDIIVEKLARKDWKLLTAYIDMGFTRDEAFRLLLSCHQ